MKKVKCIDNSTWERSLTIGRVYDVIGEEVIGEDERYYRIIDDEGDNWSYLKDRFEDVKKVSKGLEDLRGIRLINAVGEYDYDLIEKYLDSIEKELKELELHRKLFKQLDLKYDVDGYDDSGVSKSFEFYEIQSEEQCYIGNDDTIETIKKLKELVGEADE